MTYGVSALAADLRRITAEAANEAEILARVAPLAGRAARSTEWRSENLYRIDPERGSKAMILSEEPDHSLLVLAASWLPGRGAPPHDHGTWAVIVGVEGAERNIFWKRLDDRSRPGYAEVERSESRNCDAGDVIVMPSGTIHSVINESARTTLSFHVYGRHFNHTARSQYDPDARTERPLKVAMQ